MTENTTTVYKLTNSALQTHGRTQWVLGEWRKVSGMGELCTGGWLHAYSHPLLAVLLNPIHANIPKNEVRLFRAEASGRRKNDNGLKSGHERLRIVEPLQIPVVTSNQRVAFAIFCALRQCTNVRFKEWAINWLNGSDRSAEAAEADLDLIDIAKKCCVVGVDTWEL